MEVLILMERRRRLSAPTGPKRVCRRKEGRRIKKLRRGSAFAQHLYSSICQNSAGHGGFTSAGKIVGEKEISVYYEPVQRGDSCTLSKTRGVELHEEKEGGEKRYLCRGLQPKGNPARFGDADIPCRTERRAKIKFMNSAPKSGVKSAVA